MQGQPYPLINPPAQLGLNPDGMSRYVILYDFGSHPITDQPPNGWGVNRGFLYSRVIGYLDEAQFDRDQYSVYANNNTTAVATYLTMANLPRDPRFPIGMIPTTVTGLAMANQPIVQNLDVTNEVILGGQFVPANPAHASIPASLVPLQSQNLYDHPAFHLPGMGAAQVTAQMQDLNNFRSTN